MKLTGNTIFITGGGSGIGRGLAEALHKQGNQVIISGRRAERLQATIDANPGMRAVSLDITDPADIKAVAARLIADYPGLNVLVNNAGIMFPDGAEGPVDDELLSSTVDTNLLGPIRMTSALIEHLKARDGAVVANVTSVLGFVPMAITAVYSATKAALHSYTLSQRYLLRDSKVSLIEIAPPWVRTELMNSSEEERAMPLDEFVAGAIEQLGTEANEILVGPAVNMRANPGPNEHAWVNQFNDMMAAG
ncbi:MULTISPECIES: SDR family oxidoreductase [Paraburkholderia]|uniref:SDR family NAD(P)-dependent oxidoreductase n=1 Tax=Paraburkholderia madseniana TaxID=2599607 RepID=A0AAP5EUT9_9BURK|nr:MULTISPECIES: SDR family NAD(P)-dependent oxidoreductase [Paraburkholderia]MCX4145050.1 SDR family NAD(P)-dependent oxidoreductase [Paraburkholderia madseniana]MDN7148002.1 SDR family NAD(P)-dependent oxidoreductase [Paraburkholderia sp. WS6]MDQ6406882.1 SDR family NAD(P)-dependent oxidoreductase [Paraburkholderia madseniana]